jgi:small subunit ribosomal protein S17
MKQQEKKSKTNENCKDVECPFHGALRARGRTFKGEVKKIVGKRAVLEFERVIYYPKYERYAKSKTRLHARIPQCLIPQIKVGDTIKISECRPLSKIIHFVVIEKIK